MKRTLLVLVITMLMVSLCAGVFSNASDTPTDPSEIYVPQIAANEDPSIKMWFEHSFKKVMTSDTTPSEMDTYSVYMGKNEIENAQFVLCSDETKTKMSAYLTGFTDGNGNTISADIYYQMYVTLSDVDTLGYYGATAENSFIRNGEQPDPMLPTRAAGRFQLNAEKSQAYYIRLKTTEDTVPGWYSSQLNIYNSSMQVVKTATVYAYVWDFTIDEATALKTSFYLGNNTDKYGTYQEYYDYLLENRMVAMDIPGELNSSNPYLTNERVNAIRVSALNGGNTNTYKDGNGSYPLYADMYADISSMAEWEQIKDKFYFYTIDEAMSDEQQQGIVDHWALQGIVKPKGSTVDDVISAANLLSNYWPDAAKVVPYHENHPYPYNVYDKQTMATLDPSLLKDGAEAMIESESINIWCPQVYAFTPLSVIEESGFAGNNAGTVRVRSLSGSISGSIRAGESYFNWEKVFGEFRDRAISSNMVRNEKGAANNVLWAYCAGWNNTYTYANHLIESTGLQTKMLYWQLFQNDVTGYLYYGTNNWSEYDGSNGNFVDSTSTGSMAANWKTNKHPYATGYSIYGNGTLFYTASQANVSTVDYIGSIRVEHIRDGIEEYQMLTMLEELKGNEAADAIVNSVSNNVAEYLSLPGFDRSHFDSSLDDYDVMAMTRIELGNQLEAATKEACDHSYGEGVVTKDATCLEMGEMSYTCDKCGVVKVEFIPAVHATDDCWTTTTEVAPGCTTDGKLKHQCTDCGYIKFTTVTAYHNNKDLLEYTVNEKMLNVHNITCPKCKEMLDNAAHTYIAEYTNTCIDAGVHNDVCIYCGHTEKVADVEAHGHNMIETTVAPTCDEAGYTGGKCYNCGHEESETIEALGHNYVDGVCTNCGKEDPDAVTVEKGDIDGNGSINSVDLFKMNLFVKQIVAPTETEAAAADIDTNDKVNSVDMFYLKYRILKGEWGN